MVFVGLDPGPEKSAIAVIGNDDLVLYAAILDNATMLDMFHSFKSPEAKTAIEMVASYGMPVGKEVFDTCVWIGRFDVHRKASLIVRAEIKKHFCHKIVGVSDANIRQALIDRYGPGKKDAVGNKKEPGPLYAIRKDCWQALAVACMLKDFHL